MSELQDIVVTLRRAEEWVNVPMQASDAAGLRDELRNSADALSRLAQQAPVAWWNKKYGTFHTHDESDAEQSEAAKAGEIVPLCSCLVVAQAPVQAEPQPVALGRLVRDVEIVEEFFNGRCNGYPDCTLPHEEFKRIVAALKASQIASPVVAQGWQAIETLPENTKVLLLCGYEDEGTLYFVGSFKWRTNIREISEDVQHNAKGRRRIIQEIEERDREWDCHNWGATHWMPLPEPPPAKTGEKT